MIASEHHPPAPPQVALTENTDQQVHPPFIVVINPTWLRRTGSGTQTTEGMHSTNKPVVRLRQALMEWPQVPVALSNQTKDIDAAWIFKDRFFSERIMLDARTWSSPEEDEVQSTLKMLEQCMGERTRAVLVSPRGEGVRSNTERVISWTLPHTYMTPAGTQQLSEFLRELHHQWPR